MSEAETLPPPSIQPPLGPDAKWEREYREFLRLRTSLLATYAGKYVAIHEGKVVESGDDQIAVALRAYAKCGYVALHVGLVSDSPAPPLRLPSPRVWVGGGSR
ncbi:MAG: hypothetical protein HY721_31195 [Planctomycetes bacterium]|nr:hypothetical protein [Planctomycetota bacterium]